MVPEQGDSTGEVDTVESSDLLNTQSWSVEVWVGIQVAIKVVNSDT